MPTTIPLTLSGYVVSASFLGNVPTFSTGDGKVVLDTPQLANAPVSGVFDVGDTRAFVAAVSDLFALEAQQEGAGYRLKARS